MKQFLKHIIIIIIALFAVNPAQGQRIKMHIKAQFGGQFNSFIEKRDTISTDYYGGFQGGFAFRVMHKKKMFEIGFHFVRNYIDYSLRQPRPNNYVIQLNSFEIPLTAGYLTYKNPLFKNFVYGGFVSVFNIKSLYYDQDNPNDDPLVLKPKDSDLRGTQFSLRMGTQFDFYMVNLDVNYNIGLNSATKTNYRVQSHRLNFVLGILF